MIVVYTPVTRYVDRLVFSPCSTPNLSTFYPQSRVSEQMLTFVTGIARSIQRINTTTTTIEPYEEAKIVSLLTQIYDTQQLLCYFPDDSSIVYAPPEGHHIDEATCKRLNLAPAVISLMKRMPYPRDADIMKHYHLVNETRAAIYTVHPCGTRSRKLLPRKGNEVGLLVANGAYVDDWEYPGRAH